MKTKFGFLALALMINIIGSTGLGCDLWVDGKKVQPKVLVSGNAIPLNEGKNDKTVLVACEPFSGAVEGFGRIERLNVGSCTIISNLGILTLIECQK